MPLAPAAGGSMKTGFTGALMMLITGIVAGVRALTAVLMLIAVALNFANIIGRYIFFAPIASAEEVMLFLLVGTVFLGNSVVAWEGRQIRMDVILQALPSAVRRWLELLADVTAIVVSVTLIWLGWPAIAMLVEFDQRSQAAEIPLAIPQALVPIGLGMTAFLIGARLALGRKRDPAGEPPPSAAS
jgi:TRAP-type C4-dicarboxylate transport system permease small subunit